MEISAQKHMDLNRETAMRLWDEFFDMETEVEDFAGRTIAKWAYNDRNSDCGWNVDHILPQSRGGTTDEHNLICCHILTNDEKADKFPCFNANGISFEIIKVQNHYEICQKSDEPKKQKGAPKTVDFFDSAAGIRFLKKLKGAKNKKRFVGTIRVDLQNVTNTAVVDFIQELFRDENIYFGNANVIAEVPELEFGPQGQDVCVNIQDYNIQQKGKSAELLDKCVLMNTYLSDFFLEREDMSGFDIYYRIDCVEDKSEIYSGKYDPVINTYLKGANSLFVNDLVLFNTEAGERVEKSSYSEYAEYDFVFTNISKDLKKAAKGKAKYPMPYI